MKRRRPQLEELPPRVMLSAAGLAFAADAEPAVVGSAAVRSACQPDSELRDDIHSGGFDDATVLHFVGGVARICSNIDRDADSDGFQFSSRGGHVQVDVRSEIPVVLSVFNADGSVIATAEGAGLEEPGNSEEPGGTQVLEPVLVEFEAESGESYFVSVGSTKGRAGRYELVVESRGLFADLDGSGTVDFVDFLILSSNFGRDAEVVFADGDVTGDGMVDLADFLALSADFGRSND